MIKKFNATITYNTDAGHPDAASATGLEFHDTYTINTDFFYGLEDIEDYMKEDLMLVAGGGYDYNHINHIKFEIREV